VIAQVSGRLAAKQADRVMIETPGGVGYEIVVPLGVMERLPPVGEAVSLATELVVREDGWSLVRFSRRSRATLLPAADRRERRGAENRDRPDVGAGVERGARAVRDRNIALLASVSGIGKKTAERLALELADKLGEFEEAVAADAAPRGGSAEAALHALERLGYATAEADRALRQALATTAAVTRRRWYARPCNCSPTDDDAWNGRMDLHALRLDQPHPGARHRDQATDECVSCHTRHALERDARPVRWRARPLGKGRLREHLRPRRFPG